MGADSPAAGVKDSAPGYGLSARTVGDIASARPKVLEFFAGTGLARMGLESAGYRVAWANDYEPDKWDLYRGHFNDPEDGGHSFALGDVAAVEADQLPRDAKLAWG